jgi:hypothetical protein
MVVTDQAVGLLICRQTPKLQGWSVYSEESAMESCKNLITQPKVRCHTNGNDRQANGSFQVHAMFSVMRDGTVTKDGTSQEAHVFLTQGKTEYWQLEMKVIFKAAADKKSCRLLAPG